MPLDELKDRTQKNTDIFWGEIAPWDHAVQIYDDTSAFLDALEGFVAGGIRSGEAVILIATPVHRNALTARLIAAGIDLLEARVKDQYIELDAAETLSTFMVNGWPDEVLFSQKVNEILTRATAGGRKVRAFGEMVAILWARGEQAATVRLEHLWHGLCQTEQFSLFCAYPRVGFTGDPESSIAEICAAHSRVVA